MTLNISQSCGRKFLITDTSRISTSRFPTLGRTGTAAGSTGRSTPGSSVFAGSRGPGELKKEYGGLKGAWDWLLGM